MKFGQRHRGIFMAEGLIGIAMMTVVFGALICTIRAERSLAVRMANDRHDLRDVSSALLSRQHRQSTPASLHVRALPTTAPTGWQWAELSLNHVKLTALIPAEKASP